MKPPPFEHHAPRTLAEALDLLHEVGEPPTALATTVARPSAATARPM